MFVVFFCLEDTQTSNNIQFGFMSCNLSFIFDHPIICKTFKHIDQSDNSSSCVFNVDIQRFSRLIAHQSVENTNSHMTPQHNQIVFKYLERHVQQTGKYEEDCIRWPHRLFHFKSLNTTREAFTSGNLVKLPDCCCFFTFYSALPLLLSCCCFRIQTIFLSGVFSVFVAVHYIQT